MSMFELEVKTAVKNTDDESGNWFFYYKADSVQDAVDKLMEDAKKNNINVEKVVNVTTCAEWK